MIMIVDYLQVSLEILQAKSARYRHGQGIANVHRIPYQTCLTRMCGFV
jgi:hypothetical protein